MKTIRRGVFETNSSSMHSMSIISKEDFITLKNSEDYYINIGENRIYSKEEISEEIAGEMFTEGLTYKELMELDKPRFDEIASNYEYTDYKSYINMPYEVFQYAYTSESGDEITILGFYE